jgi:hypothetical protein
MRGSRCSKPVRVGGSSPNLMASEQPMIGCMPEDDSLSENSSAPNRLPVSVNAKAG